MGVADGEEPIEADRDRILSEKLWGELENIRQYVQDIPEIKDRLGRLESDVSEMKGIQIVHGEILKEHSAELREIKQIVGGHHEAIAELKLASHTH
jgi:hypothetical protein